MKQLLRSALFVFGLAGYINSFAQPGCPAVDAGADVTLGCGETCATLRASVFAGHTTASYSVDSIPYAPPFPFNAGIPILVNLDDAWSDTIDLPFNFVFFGNVYNKIVVGANGMISFNLNNANGLNSWQIQGPLPANYWGDIRNAIMGPWQDIDPTNRGRTFYQITGTYPCRNFVVSWDSVPYYGDANSQYPVFNPDSTDRCPVGFATQQIVLYEISNTIEMYIKDKEVCSGWNPSVTGTGVAVQGIQNGTQFTPPTQGYFVPGRNATVWTAHNDAWRFTPSGALNTAVAWYDDTTLISSVDSVVVCPEAGHTYTAQATYFNTDGTTTVVTDDVNVGFSGVVVSIDSVIQPTCGASNGAVYASFDVIDTGALSYGWFPGGAGQLSMTNLPIGVYIFSVTDSAFCVHSDTVVLTSTPAFQVTVDDTTIYSCTGSVTGELTAVVTGDSTGVYTYLWSNLAPTPTISGIAPGTYGVLVMDTNNCFGADTGTVFLVTATPTFSASAVVTNVSCFGGSDGSIVVTVDSAVAPINFNWSGGLPNNDTVTGLTVGVYDVTATDANGCTATASYTVSEPPALIIDTATITPVTCTVGGTITASATGGMGTLIYNWSNGDTGTLADSLAAGTYSLIVTDQNLCSASASYTVTAVAPATLGIPTIGNVLCNGDNTGSITATASGGAPISFLWSSGQTTATISNLPAGCYSVSASDTNGCVDTATYCITEPTAIVIGTPTVTQATCTVGGTIQASASGGTGVLVYNWSNADTGAFIDSLAAGTYILTVTDDNLCVAIDTVDVPADPSVVVFGNPVITNVLCNGDSTGRIVASASGGTGPITFNWSNGVTGPVDSNLAAGVYQLTISDTNGCSASTTYVVTQPSAITPTLTLSTPICISTTGNGTVSVTGGTPGYTYLWNNQSDSTYTDNLFPGAVSVTVTDANLCSVVATGTIQTMPDFTPTSIVRSYPCTNPAFGTDSIVVTGGVGPFTYILVGVDSNSTGVFPNLQPGNYTWIVRDSLGCSKSSVFTILPSASNDNYTVATTDASCFGVSDGSITITPLSSNPSYSYSLNGGAYQSSNVFSVTGGSYSIVAQNGYGCTVALSASVNQPPADSFTVATTPTSCFGSQFTDGSIIVHVFSANAPYTFAVDGGAAQSDSVFLNVSAGTHTVVATNNQGCSFSLNAVVDEPGQVTVDATPDSLLVSPGAANSINVVTQNFVNPVYSWSPADGLSCTNCNNPTVTVGASTVYYVTVSETDAECVASDSVVVIVVSSDYRIPNAFTPNGDGKNETFGPFPPSVLTIKGFRIYNRWGEMVFNGTGNWDGTYKGEQQPPGTYVYYISVELPDKNNPSVMVTENKQGSFSLIR